MKTSAIKLTKTDAIVIAHRALVETIAARPGIWTYLNTRVRTAKQLAKASVEKRGKQGTLCSA